MIGISSVRLPESSTEKRVALILQLSPWVVITFMTLSRVASNRSCSYLRDSRPNRFVRLLLRRQPDQVALSCDSHSL